MVTNCPKCKNQVYCPCKTCSAYYPDKLPKWIWLSDGERIKCPFCGFVAHADIWLEEEMKEMNKFKP
jgi:hypothetical protein